MLHQRCRLQAAGPANQQDTYYTIPYLNPPCNDPFVQHQKFPKPYTNWIELNHHHN